MSVGSIILWILFGLVVGLIARLLVPGKDNIGIIRTIILGVLGSVIGGAAWSLITIHRVTGFQPLSLIGSIIVAIILLVIYNKVTGRKRRA